MERGTKLFPAIINKCHLKILSIPWTTSIIVHISLKLTFFILTWSHQYDDPIMHSKQLISAWGTDQNWLAAITTHGPRTGHIPAPGQGQAKQMKATSKLKANAASQALKTTCTELCSKPFKQPSFNNFNEDKWNKALYINSLFTLNSNTDRMPYKHKESDAE